MLYKEEKDITYKSSFKELPSGEIEISFTCDGGKFGTEEHLCDFDVTPSQLMEILRNHFYADLGKPIGMTRKAFIKKWLANPAKQYNEQCKDEMREDLDLVIAKFNKKDGQ